MYSRAFMPPLAGLGSIGYAPTHGFRHGPDFAGPCGPDKSTKLWCSFGAEFFSEL
jgi:hypothetical protein